MFSSFFRRPLEPPSSLTVTTAQSSLIRGCPDCGAGVAYFLSPFRSVERPVPPPIATTRKPCPSGCSCRPEPSEERVSLICAPSVPRRERSRRQQFQRWDL